MIDVDGGGEGWSENSWRYPSDYQPVSDALETDTEEEWTTDREEERDTEKEDVSLYESPAAKMTDTKSVSSVEVPEGKLLKKVSRC